MNKYRTHKCNELRKEDVDKKISLSGWIKKKRDQEIARETDRVEVCLCAFFLVNIVFVLIH